MTRRWAITTAVAAGLVLAAGAGYHFWPAGKAPADEVAPPQIDLTGADAQVVNAISAARDLVKTRPQSADAWGRLGMVLYAHDFHTEALECFDRAGRLDPADARWPYYQGTILMAEHPAEALAPLERAAERSPRDPTPRLRLAETLLALERLDEAEAHFKRAGRGDDPRALMGLGLIARRRGDVKGCLPLLERAAASPYARRAARSVLAEAHERLGHAAEAQRLQTEAARLPKDPPWPDPLLAAVTELQTGTRPRLNQVNALLNAGRTADAVTLTRQILHDDPESDLARLALGRALMQARDFAGAAAAMAEAARRRPDSVDAHLILGGALQALGRPDDAAAGYRRVLELNPAHGLAHYNLGLCLRKSGDRTGAKAALRDAVRCRPDLQAAHVELAELLLEEGERAGAAERLRDALRLDPNDERAKNLLTSVNRP